MLFVILSAPRSGSTHLVNLLCRHPEVACHGEVFGKKRVLFWGAGAERNKPLAEELFALRDADAEGFLERIFGLNMGRTHVGFKIFEEHGRQIIDRLIDDVGIKKIFLYRGNILAAYSSSVVAKATGVWGTRQRSMLPEGLRAKFVAKRFLKFHDRRVRFFRDTAGRTLSSGQQFYWLPYEQLNEPLCILNLLGFIGAQPQLNAPGLLEPKRSPTKVSERFENPEEVEAFLRERNLQHWIYEAEQTLEPFDVHEAAAGGAFQSIG